MHCDPNAYCLLVPETSDFKCECKPGYNGTGKVCTGMAVMQTRMYISVLLFVTSVMQNELFTDVCTGYCDNEGTCVKDSRGQPSCRCIGSFTGKHCQEKSEFAYIAGGIAGAVIFIIIIVLLVWMICVRSVLILFCISLQSLLFTE